MGSGWAYVDCSDSGGGQAAGPTGSVQFLTGANATSGSTNLLYHTAAVGGLPASTMVLSGTLIVTGNISASSYTIKEIAQIDGTGSTFFGDTVDDVHARTGSLRMYDGTLGSEPYIFANPRAKSISGNKALELRSASFMPHYSASGQLGGTATITVGSTEHIIGIQSTGTIAVVLPRGNSWDGCKVMVIKDEVLYRTGSISITVTAGGTIDGETSYELSGTMPAINLYTNGSNWFVY